MIETHFDVFFSSSGAVSTSGEAFIPRASGGPVVPGRAYTIGEHGPETLLMGRSGGYVLPSGGGGSQETGRGPASVNIYITGDGLNAEQVAAAIDNRTRRLWA
jgi:hypothetical protein